MQMLDKFPMEGGQKDPKQRIIPFLPGGRDMCSERTCGGSSVAPELSAGPLGGTDPMARVSVTC